MSETHNAFTGTPEELLQIDEQSFRLLRAGAFDGLELFSHHSLTSDGVRIVPLERADLLTPRERMLFMHPTGNPGEPILTFPCAIHELIAFNRREAYGEMANETLIEWISGRVRANRERPGWEWLDKVAHSIFVVGTAEEFRRLVPESAEERRLPCSLRALVRWCDGARQDGERKPQATQPTNNRIIEFVLGRLESSVRDPHSRQVTTAVCTPVIGSKEWFSNKGRKMAMARDSMPGGYKEKREKIQAVWATGKYLTRIACAEAECVGLQMSFDTARKALSTPKPKAQR